MMGFNEVANQDHSLGDPFKGGRKLQPLVPRPFLSSPTPNHNVNTTCLTGFHHNPTNFHNKPSNHHILSLNNTTTTRHQHHFEEGKEAVGTHQVMVSSRWNPTPEQLRALEELYRRGTRTPSAEQIQHITAQLRRYGKIEGKNVFYWFQNHKARERQKRRRQLQLPLQPPSGSKIGFEGEQKSCKWAQSSTNKEESDPPIQISEEAAALTKSDITTNPISSDGERNSTWQTTTTPTHDNNNIMMVQPLSCSCCFPSSVPFSLSSKHNFPSIITSKDLNIINNGGDDFGERRPSSPTLQLFPVVRDDDNDNNDDGDDDENNSCLTTTNNNDHEKGGSSSSSIHDMPKLLVCNNNNPFPYYQFL
ncbi:uncharacterized protein LOC110692073 isoform X2 [Chenopodium quinoa]|uniref:uncharacterized protein LOC110692073 isoform X2 n=1 Tax=Chenopodium quinoa TaxID=63459 RepID=UPI000B779C2A|nr:uncharacterized protein LOC110692073 isoform X2 [Chenopodium quinoa]